MSTHIAEAASNWRTRTAVLLVLLLATVGAVFALQRDAQATIPNSTAIVSQSTAGPVAPGETISYTISITNNVATDNGGVTARLDWAGTSGLLDGSLVLGDGTNGAAAPTGGFAACTDTYDNTDTVRFAQCVSGAVLGVGTHAVSFAAVVEGNVVDPTVVISDADGALAAGSITDNTSALTFDATLAATVSPNDTNALGVGHTFTFTLDPNVDCASGVAAELAGDNADDQATVTCDATDVNTTLAIDSVVVTSGAIGTATTVAVTVNGAVTGTVSLDLVANSGDTVVGDGVPFISDAATKTYAAAELRHVDDDGDIIGTNVNPVQDVPNNVVGRRHTVCVFADDDSGDTALQIPISVGDINHADGGGYTAVGVPAVPSWTDPLVFVGGTGNALNATCFSWLSTQAGDQEISVEYVGDDGNFYQIDWDTDLDTNNTDVIQGNNALVKQWNQLEESCIYLDEATTAVACDDDTEPDFTPPTVEINRAATFSPANSTYTIDPVFIEDMFEGSHVDSAGGTWQGALWGVEWEAAINGSCGSFDNSSDVETASGTTGYDTQATMTVYADDDCTLNDSIEVEICGSEPGPLGSGTGDTVCQTIVINFVTTVSTKKVFLAWAGQRIVLEVDHRIPAGDEDGEFGDDDDDPDPLGTCAFDPEDVAVLEVRYVKSSGPGTFMSGLGAGNNGSDEAWVDVSSVTYWDPNEARQADEFVPGWWDTSGIFSNGLQPGCISRVLFESEDQGQVDIEAEVDEICVWNDSGHNNCNWEQLENGFNQTKTAFVIYYMKINDVTTTLVTSQHNSYHNAVGADWVTGNPWDNSTDETSASWNVSEDLLVRIRVRGWFTNSNPSGRERDATNPQNVLPVDRWIMPDDWVNLAGGVGLANTFRPEYDIMINPSGPFSLDIPEGGTGAFVATSKLAADATNIASSISVTPASDAAKFAVGSTIRVNNEEMTVLGVPAGPSATTGKIYVDRAENGTSPGTHVAGDVVSLFGGTGVPFEGPFSVLDLVPLGSSAALSDWDPNNVRDTIFKDLNVDWWDAPMPPALVTADIAGTGFLSTVYKDDVYYRGTANSTPGQVYPNPYYIQDIPGSPFIPAVVAGGGYFWDTWGNDGPGGNGDGVYRFWNDLPSAPTNDASSLVLYSDNHGEVMVIANGDDGTTGSSVSKITFDECVVNFMGGWHCDLGDVVGSASIFATADYPDFRGKHFPVQSFSATVDWTWGGYKAVTVEDGATEQFKYVVLHVVDRDGFCAPTLPGIILHGTVIGENVDFLIDGGEGKIISTSSGTAPLSGEQGAAQNVKTFSTLLNNPAVSGIAEFPHYQDGFADECQAWIQVSSSLLDTVDILIIAEDPEGLVGFDELVNFTSTIDYTLTFRWSLITWNGEDGIAPAAALSGGTPDITASVTAIYGWAGAAQTWLGFFPAGVNVPGANDLNSLSLGQAYWIAITGPNSITWTVTTNVN